MGSGSRLDGDIVYIADYAAEHVIAYDLESGG